MMLAWIVLWASVGWGHAGLDGAIGGAGAAALVGWFVCLFRWCRYRDS